MYSIQYSVRGDNLCPVPTLECTSSSYDTKTEYFTETSFGPFQPSSIPVPLTILRVLHRDILLSHSTIFAHQFSRRHSRMSQQRRNSTSSGYLTCPMWIKRSCASSKHPFNNYCPTPNLPNHTASIHPNYSQPKLTLHAPHHTS